jgi:hypothetical protein
MAQNSLLNNKDYISVQMEDQAIKPHGYSVGGEALPTSTMVTMSKSQSQTVVDIYFTLSPRSKNTSTSCESHGMYMFCTNGGVGFRFQLLQLQVQLTKDLTRPITCHFQD